MYKKTVKIYSLFKEQIKSRGYRGERSVQETDSKRQSAMEILIEAADHTITANITLKKCSNIHNSTQMHFKGYNYNSLKSSNQIQ